MKCKYCGNEWEESKFHAGRCGSCGAPREETNPVLDHSRVIDHRLDLAKRELRDAGIEWGNFCSSIRSMNDPIKKAQAMYTVFGRCWGEVLPFVEGGSNA